jgi:hypothetical protein
MHSVNGLQINRTITKIEQNGINEKNQSIFLVKGFAELEL